MHAREPVRLTSILNRGQKFAEDNAGETGRAIVDRRHGELLNRRRDDVDRQGSGNEVNVDKPENSGALCRGGVKVAVGRKRAQEMLERRGLKIRSCSYGYKPRGSRPAGLDQG